MFKIHYHAPGTAPGTLVERSHIGADRPSQITLFSYNKENLDERTCASIEELRAHLKKDRVNWVHVGGLNDTELLRSLGETFGLHPLSLEDVQMTTQRPKVERYEGYIFILTKLLYFTSESDLVVEQMSVFLGRDFVITIQEGSKRDAFEMVRDRIRHSCGQARDMGPDYLCYALLDSLVDQFFPVLEIVGDKIEDLESELLDCPHKVTQRKLYDAKRLLLQIRRAAWPQREIFNVLLHDDSGMVKSTTQIFLRDCYDHVSQIIDIIENFRDLTAGLMEVYLSSLSLRTNEIMRVLTVVMSIFIPLTFVVGLYGMNFDPQASPWNMPELKMRYGYVGCLAFLAILALVQIFILKRKKWL